MNRTEVIEGTWEELSARAEEFKGHKLRLIVLPPEADNSQTISTEATLQAATRLFAEADMLERKPGEPSHDSYENAFGKVLTEKYRKMGLDV